MSEFKASPDNSVTNATGSHMKCRIQIAQIGGINYPPAAMILKSLTIIVAIFTAVGCAKEIGDPCETSVDCDIQNKRICDLTQPEGYCTLKGCEKGTCPEEAVCVQFRPEPIRLSSTWCMASCDDDDDCRDGYACRTADSLGDMQSAPTESDNTDETDAGVAFSTTSIARNIDNKSAKFCTVKPIEPKD